MVTSCSVKGCKSKAGQGIKLHRLPKGEIREAWITFLKKFNPQFMPTSHSTNVCGLHFFTDLDYEVTPTSIYQTKRLKKNAVPSILNQNIGRSLFHKSNQELNRVPDHDAKEEVVILSWSDLNAELSSVPPAVLQHNVLPKPTVQNVSTVSPAPVQNTNESPPALVKKTVQENLLRPNNKRKSFMGDFIHPSDIDCPNNRLKYWIASQKTVLNQKKKKKFLYKQTVDLKKKIKKLESLLDQLKNEKKKESNNYCSTVSKELTLSSSQLEIYMSMCKPI